MDYNQNGETSNPVRFEADSSHDFLIVYKAKKESSSCLDIFLRQVQDDLGLKIKKLLSSKFDEDGLVYGLISAPRQVLADRAQKLKISIPLQKPVDEEFSRSKSYMKTIMRYFYPCLESGFFKIPYDAKYEEYINSSAFTGGDPFTSSRIRIMLIYDLLKDIDITSELKVKEPRHPSLNCDEYRGLKWLEENKFIVDSFPLHCKEEARNLAGSALYSKASWYKAISLTSLRNYLGEKIGMSFAWRSAWLSNALGFPILFGLITLFYDIADAYKNNSLGTEILTFGNATPYYACLMCIWAALFPKMWSNVKYVYSFKWGTISYTLLGERAIVKFSTMQEKSGKLKKWVYVLTWLCTFVSTLIGVAYCFKMIYIQMALETVLHGKISKAHQTASAVVSFVNTILLDFVINPMFEWSSWKLTELERHHFDSDFERALTIRVFFNAFFNNNLRILMMLLVPRFYLENIFTRKADTFKLCKKGECPEAIGYQVAFFLLSRPVTGIAKYMWHTITMLLCRKIATKDQYDYDRPDCSLIEFVEKQHKLFSGQRFGEKFTTMDDMNARVAQYGFVVMYAAVFPLAPLIAFIMEYFVRRADIGRYLRRQRRPIPRRQEGIGAWEDIIEFVNLVAICTNVWIIAFRSDKLLEEYVTGMAVISAGVILTSTIRAVTSYNTIPEKVKILQRQEEITAKEFLVNMSGGNAYSDPAPGRGEFVVENMEAVL